MDKEKQERMIVREFQDIKWMTLEQFIDRANFYISCGYGTAMTHFIDAISCHPRISKPMLGQVLHKVDEIRELWDGVTLGRKIQEAPEPKLAEQYLNELTFIEAQLYGAKSGDVIQILGKRFRVEPLDEEGASST
ncbi:hypothetical protein [Paenibacillus agilis]|uniref:Uncharacterized protein n=1 Tax=Paenibacillus agilis TaxID=3020863 RepID=A0A559IZG9_9BACL|nr:hypothetical protein [Paenibacillus agilis]TVX93025.1 hypothetical protein FPZ44_08120 [Paenibacillus agilis]